MIEKQTDEQIISQIKSDKFWVTVTSTSGLLFLVMFAYYSYIMRNDNNFYNLVISGFYLMFLTIINADYSTKVKINKLFLEIRDNKTKKRS